MSRRGAVAALLVAAAAQAGCGEDAEQPAPPPAPPPAESVDHLPDLPASWKRHLDRPGGFAIGVPRSWKARRHRHALVVRSTDRLVAISITADRSAAGLAVEPREFASRAIAALPGFGRPLRIGAAHDFDTTYDAVAIRARGEDRGGIAERVTLIVLRRDSIATYTAVIAANAKRARRATVARAERVVRTLRGRPPGGS